MAAQRRGDVLARVETLRPGDRVFRPHGRDEGYPVVEVEQYEDGRIVVVYSTGQSSRARFGETVLSTPDVLASFAPLTTGDRIRCRRDGTDPAV